MVLELLNAKMKGLSVQFSKIGLLTKKLSRRKIGFLETVYSNTLHDLNHESCLSPKLAPGWMRSELDKSWLLFEIQCVADLLDFLKPRDGLSLIHI